MLLKTNNPQAENKRAALYKCTSHNKREAVPPVMQQAQRDPQGTGGYEPGIHTVRCPRAPICMWQIVLPEPVSLS